MQANKRARLGSHVAHTPFGVILYRRYLPSSSVVTTPLSTSPSADSTPLASCCCCCSPRRSDSPYKRRRSLVPTCALESSSKIASSLSSSPPAATAAAAAEHTTLPSTSTSPRIASGVTLPGSPRLSSAHSPHTVTDEELELASDDSTVLPPLVFLPDEKKRSKVQWDAVSMQQDDEEDKRPKSPAASTSPRALPSHGSVRSMYQRNLSASEFSSSTPALVTTVVNSSRVQSTSAGLSALSSPRLIREKTFIAGMRRATVSANGVSHHALDRLGVNADILKKEKGMKKLGISDVDIERSEELRRYTGIATKKMGRNKAELVFGFTDEQLQRDKAIKRLGTTEQEIFDDYCRRVSMLGTHDRPMTTF